MKGFHYLLALALMLSGCEAKGEEMARIDQKNITVRTEEGRGRVMVSIPFSWRQNLTGVEISAHPVPDKPDVMPYKIGDVRERQFRGLILVYKTKPDKVTVRITGTRQNGRTYVDTQEVVIPEARIEPNGGQRSRSATPGVDIEDRKEEARKNLERMKLKASIEKDDVEVKTRNGGTEYNYRIRAIDTPITSVVIQFPGAVQVTRTPNGWKAHAQSNSGGGEMFGTTFGSEGGTVTWSAATPDSAIKPGKAERFQVTGSPRKDNASYLIGGGGKMANGSTFGPGN